MRSAGVLIGFVPLIVYGVLAGNSVMSVIIALGAATVTTIVVGFTDLRKRRILTWSNLMLFGSLLLAVGVLGMTGLLPLMGMLIYTTLAAVTFGSILAGTPFTLQYAREMVDRSLWKNPVFIRVNVLMTGVWGSIFVINLMLNYLMLVNPELQGGVASMLTYIVLVAGIVFTIWYPGYLQKNNPLLT
jgi:hypothetical protein